MANDKKAESYLKKHRFIIILLAFTSVALILIIINSYYVFINHKLMKKGRRWPAGSYRYNRTIGYEMTPNFSSRMLNRTFYTKTHNLGYRIPEFSDSHKYNRGGILSVGCSFTYGDMVAGEETFTYLAAQQMNLPSYNFGVCSYSYAAVIYHVK